MDNLNHDYKEVCLQLFIGINKSEDLNHSSDIFCFVSKLNWSQASRWGQQDWWIHWRWNPCSVSKNLLKTTTWPLYLGVRPRQPLRGGNYGYWASLSPHGWIWRGGCPRGHVRSRRRRDGNGALLFCRRDGAAALAEDALGHALHVVLGRAQGLRHLLLGLGHKVGVFRQRGQTPAHQSLGENDKFKGNLGREATNMVQSRT